MERTPASLLDRLRRPDEAEAWTRFVHLYTPLLFSWARRLGLREADAADLVQEVLLLLCRKLPAFSYDAHKSFRGWLWTVTLNKWREARRRSPSVSVEASAALDELPAHDEEPALEEAEYRRYLIGRALQTLEAEFSPLTWKAFQGYVMAGRAPAEVAVELNIGLGTVYAAKSRVLSRLRQELTGLLE